ncbi:MAG: hypothetical protein IKX23_01700 [Treponema sp.]|nr:hypothetical protein [Treponema sp.]
MFTNGIFNFINSVSASLKVRTVRHTFIFADNPVHHNHHLQMHKGDEIFVNITGRKNQWKEIELL